VAVTEHDVRHIAALARLGLTEERIPSLVRELNGILEHMDVLQRANTAGIPAIGGVGAQGMPLRRDGGAQYPLARPREDFAPAMRDGFFLVPRLATHESLGEADANEA
jgi:aspartyl-tRNA(Asn)/glutamyl-tRNA(Gln) amidotransferase subunit C